MTDESEDLFGFIGSSFRSVWALELLLLMKRDSRPWASADLVSALRASDLVVNKALAELVAAGLVSVDQEGARYMPATSDMGASMERVETLYAARPDAVRRAIVSSAATPASAFADAFRLRKD